MNSDRANHWRFRILGSTLNPQDPFLSKKRWYHGLLHPIRALSAKNWTRSASISKSYDQNKSYIVLFKESCSFSSCFLSLNRTWKFLKKSVKVPLFPLFVPVDYYVVPYGRWMVHFTIASIASSKNVAFHTFSLLLTTAGVEAPAIWDDVIIDRDEIRSFIKAPFPQAKT